MTSMLSWRSMDRMVKCLVGVRKIEGMDGTGICGVSYAPQRSAFVVEDDAGLAKHFASKCVAYDRRACVRIETDFVDTQGIYGDDILMRTVTRWWARAAVPRTPIVCPALHSADRKPLDVAGTRPAGQLHGARRDVEYEPMPPPTSGWSIGIVHGNGKALRARRGVHPRELWTNVLACATETTEDLADICLATNIGAQKGERFRFLGKCTGKKQ